MACVSSCGRIRPEESWGFRISGAPESELSPSCPEYIFPNTWSSPGLFFKIFPPHSPGSLKLRSGRFFPNCRARPCATCPDNKALPCSPVLSSHRSKLQKLTICGSLLTIQSTLCCILEWCEPSANTSGQTSFPLQYKIDIPWVQPIDPGNGSKGLIRFTQGKPSLPYSLQSRFQGNSLPLADFP